MSASTRQRPGPPDAQVTTSIPFSTRYFTVEEVKLGVGGCCHDFAIAVHRRTGMAFGVIWRVPLPGDYGTIPVHVFCYDADGSAVDIEGLHDVEDLLPRYCDMTRPVAPRVDRYETETDLVAALHVDCYLTLREDGVAGADAVIAGSPEFLDLLESIEPDSGRERETTTVTDQPRP